MYQFLGGVLWTRESQADLSVLVLRQVDIGYTVGVRVLYDRLDVTGHICPAACVSLC